MEPMNLGSGTGFIGPVRLAEDKARIQPLNKCWQISLMLKTEENI